MAVCAVYKDEHNTYIYDSHGNWIDTFDRTHQNSYGAGNSVTIDQRDSHGCMTILTYDDNGHRISEAQVPV